MLVSSSANEGGCGSEEVPVVRGGCCYLYNAFWGDAPDRSMAKGCCSELVSIGQSLSFEPGAQKPQVVRTEHCSGNFILPIEYERVPVGTGQTCGANKRKVKDRAECVKALAELGLNAEELFDLPESTCKSKVYPKGCYYMKNFKGGKPYWNNCGENYNHGKVKRKYKRSGGLKFKELICAYESMATLPNDSKQAAENEVATQTASAHTWWFYGLIGLTVTNFGVFMYLRAHGKRDLNSYTELGLM